MNAVTEVMDELRKALALVDQLGDARDKAERELAELQRRTSEALAQAVEWQRERDEARREADRFRHGCTVEGDFVCPNEYAVSELTAERNFLRALKKNHEEDFTRVCKERDEARADLARSVAAWESAGMQGKTAHDALLAIANERDEALAIVDVLRGVGCSEDGDGPCGVCRKCAYRHGAEAMREACAKRAWDKILDAGKRTDNLRKDFTAQAVRDALRALPIPEEP